MCQMEIFSKAGKRRLMRVGMLLNPGDIVQEGTHFKTITKPSRLRQIKRGFDSLTQSPFGGEYYIEHDLIPHTDSCDETN